MTTSTMTNQDGCEGSNLFRRQTNNSLAQLLQEQPDMVRGCMAGLKARLSVEQQAAVEAVLAPSSGHLSALLRRAIHEHRSARGGRACEAASGGGSDRESPNPKHGRRQKWQRYKAFKAAMPLKGCNLENPLMCRYPQSRHDQGE